MNICHPETDWSCRFSEDDLTAMRADEVTAAQLERAEGLAWSLLASLTAYTIGVCPTVVRPCAARCAPRGGYHGAPVGGGSWAPIPIGRMSPYISGGRWFNACPCTSSDACSCTAISEVILPGPVGRINYVRIDGEDLPRSAYRIDNGVHLVRTDGEVWPACQDMAAEFASFEVSYYQGAAPNVMTQAAAGALAAEFYAACRGEDCRLPWNLQTMTRNGESYDFGEGSIDGVVSGMPEVAAVVRIYNPYGLKSQPVVASPDLYTTRRRTA